MKITQNVQTLKGKEAESMKHWIDRYHGVLGGFSAIKMEFIGFSL